ncbi:MAG: hypothetical protein M1823_003263 [Watsoniomyces obsoletus]|nr:MAG: hypothetical protein M1823_003263 [Watsoniomyces obsoletus]
MSFGRAGGGLSINTGTANNLFNSNTSGDPVKPVMFGATTQASQAGGLFGSMAQQSQAQTTGGLFGASNTQKPGLFGASNQPAPSQPSGSVFGQSAAQSQPSVQGGSLFGMANAQQSQSQPQQSGGLLAGFGAQPTQPQPSSGLLAGFGGQQSQQQQQQQQQAQTQQGGSLFGANNQQSQQQPQQQQPPRQGGSLFGMNNLQSRTQPGEGMFGGLSLGQLGGTSGALLNPSQNSTQTRPPPNGGFFPTLGASTTQSTPGHTGPGLSSSMANPAGTLGGNGPAFSNLQTQPVTTGVKIDLNHARITTRFTDLHDDLQREIELIDALVMRQISGYHQCQGLMPTHGARMEYLPNDVTYVERRLKSLNDALESDAQAVHRLRADAKRDIEEAKLCFAAVDHLKLLPQHQPHGMFLTPRMHTSLSTINGHARGDTDRPRDLIALIGQRADSMAQTLQTYQRNLAEVEAHLGTMEMRTAEQMQQLAFRRGSDGMTRPATDQLRELAGVLRDFEHGIVSVAGKVGTVRDELRELTLEMDLMGGSQDAGGGVGRITNGRGR